MASTTLIPDQDVMPDVAGSTEPPQWHHVDLRHHIDSQHHIDKTASHRHTDAVMRTTLTLADDVIKLAKMHAERRKMTLGEAVSELVRRGAERPLALDDLSGLKVARLPEDSPRITAQHVNQLMEEIE